MDGSTGPRINGKRKAPLHNRRSAVNSGKAPHPTTDSMTYECAGGMVVCDEEVGLRSLPVSAERLEVGMKAPAPVADDACKRSARVPNLVGGARSNRDDCRLADVPCDCSDDEPERRVGGERNVEANCCIGATGGGASDGA